MHHQPVKRIAHFSVVILTLSLAGGALAQTAHSSGDRQAAKRDGFDSVEASLPKQLAELRAKVARLEAALEQNHQGQSSGTDAASHPDGMGHGDASMSMSGAGMKGGMAKSDQKSGMSMGTMGGGMTGGSGKKSSMDMGMMGMGGMMGGGMSGMSKGSGQQSGMGMGKMGKGMRMMGMMKGMGGSQGMAMQSALPGFPGASHLYHIGATGFFLDHADHIQLTTEQQAALNQIKEKTALEQATTERKIEEAEQQLWQATASDRPDAATIETKIREIEKLRGDQRFAFIRAVGEAAKVLSHEQHQTLTGAHSGPKSPAAHTKHQP